MTYECSQYTAFRTCLDILPGKTEGGIQLVNSVISQMATETELNERYVPIREMIPTTAQIFLIPTNATLDGNVLTKQRKYVDHQLKDKVLESTIPANNTANQFQQTQIKILFLN